LSVRPLQPATRLAPSPTGALHLGNARTFLVNWLMARQNDWRIILRIEDLDGPRVKLHADQQAIDDLKWLGIDWDEGPTYQSQRNETYDRAIDELLTKKLAYPCICTRKEIDLASSAPHADDGSTMYPRTCRGRFRSVDEARESAGRMPAIRFDVGDETIGFTDEFAGEFRFEMASQLGDFVVRKNDGLAAYQLAVVVDDAEANITHIVRGDDLIDSTPRQIMIYRALDLESKIPKYWHLPLVVGTDGRRLAKRHGDTRISKYRSDGVNVERMLGLIGRWCGIEVDEIDLTTFLNRFDIQRIPKSQIVFQDDFIL